MDQSQSNLDENEEREWDVDEKEGKGSRSTLCYLICCLLMSLFTLAACVGLIFAILYVGDNRIFMHKASVKARDISLEPFIDVEAKLPSCSSGDFDRKKLIKCGKSTFQHLNTTTFEPELQDEEDIGRSGHWEGVKPLRYDLNLTFKKSGLDFFGKVSILLEAKETVSRIPINMDTIALRSPHWERGIIVRKRCSLERICIKKVTVLPQLQVLLLEPQVPIEHGQLFTVLLTGFSGSIFDDWNQNGSLGTYSANKMGDNLATGTIFQMRYARTVFPCLDHPSLKAKFRLCVRHSSEHGVLSNTDVENVTTLSNKRVETCFPKTPVLPTYVFTFSVVSKLDLLSNQTKDVRIDVYGPEGETKSLQWIIPETIWAMGKLEKMSNRNYGLNKLAFLNVDPTPFWGIENYGLVAMDYGWTSYPLYEKPHQILIHEITHQWIGDLFTIRSWNEICLQEGLTSFFEWSLTSQLTSVELDFNQTVSRAILEGLTSDNGKHPIIRSDFKKTKDIQDRCFTKPPIAFCMLAQIFGQDIVAKFFSELTRFFFYRNAGLTEWVAVLNKVANSNIAGKLLENFYKNPGYPVLFAKNTSATEVTVIQKMFMDEKIQKITSDEDAFVVPLSVKTSAGEEVMKIEPIRGEEKKISLPESFKWFILDPAALTYSRTIYTAENYLEIVRCYKKHGEHCVLSKTEIVTMFANFCFVLLEDQLPLDEDDSRTDVWRELKVEINDLRPSLELDYPCKCCFMTESQIRKDHGGFFQGCKDGYDQHCKSLKLMQILK